MNILRGNLTLSIKEVNVVNIDAVSSYYLQIENKSTTEKIKGINIQLNQAIMRTKAHYEGDGSDNNWNEKVTVRFSSISDTIALTCYTIEEGSRFFYAESQFKVSRFMAGSSGNPTNPNNLVWFSLERNKVPEVNVAAEVKFEFMKEEVQSSPGGAGGAQKVLNGIVLGSKVGSVLKKTVVENS